MVGVQIPHHFRCPILLELMLDPVMVSTGQTYDRSNIKPWIAASNTTCPVTHALLLDFILIPNHTLCRLIQSCCIANRHSGVERIPTPKQPADPSRIHALLSQATSTSSTAAAAPLSSLPSFVIDSLQALLSDSSSSSSKMIVKVMAATVANSLVVATLFFFAIQRRRHRKGPNHGPAKAGGFMPMPRGGTLSLDLKRP